MIYIIQPISGGGIKFGSSGFPEVRRASIQAVFPYGVEILATMDGGFLGEAFICNCFEPIGMGGPSREWFFPTPQIWRFIIDVIDNGRPAFVPEEDRTFDAHTSAMEMFGSKERALKCLGYSSATTFDSIFNGYKGRAKVLLAKALREGILPEYIAALHRGSAYVAEAA